MGVHGLWDLLSPVGRRVSVETLAGKRLAIDASIWMIQFMKAMRDERGEMVRNAHILGFFRRICKLLFLRTKPVFVFDGATPALKRRTVIARRRQRENAQTKIRKTAEKLLLNHLKAMRLKELANDLENQRKNNDKGKRVITDTSDLAGTDSNTNSQDTKEFDQEALDAMLAASIAAEEGEGFIGDASTSGAGVLAEDEDDDDEEIQLPTIQGKVDPAVLASLPPSMQLDLLGQMRERLMAENRQKYQKVKKAPARFSELQIEAYLKTVAFRREIDEVQKAAGGRGIGGVKTSRIASEANREFIFSSSFTGNRQSFASSGMESSSNVQNQVTTENPSNKSKSAIESMINKPKKAFNKDVETYKDERGRVRVSKVRAMGIRMTRDLQRNLDLIKEIEQDRVDSPLPNKLPESSNLSGTSHQDKSSLKKTNQESIPVSGTSIEVSFEDDKEQDFVDSYDDVFASIVAGDPLAADNTSDIEWEEGIPGVQKLVVDDNASDENDVEWEEGPSDNPESVAECRETASKGDLLEEADFQEAIRLSMEEIRFQKDTEANNDEENMATESPITQFEVTASDDPSSVEMQKEISHPELSIRDTIDDQNDQRETGDVDVINPTKENGVKLSNELHENYREGNTESTHVDSNSLSCTTTHISNLSDVGMPDVQKFEVKPPVIDHISETVDVQNFEVKAPVVNHIPETVNVQKFEVKAPVIDHIPETVEPKETTVNKSKPDSDVVVKDTEQREDDVSKFVLTDMNEEQVEIARASLEEEMANLSKERVNLGDEQRRLERNAESVSGEMFAECQELLQMFGLPYIIAPMEAEAQCAHMELENLVDGVVTDDSDVLLFGARSVYKNIFDDRKYVETYFMKDIETELGLTREKLIRMAMLLGSDYTEGISGIGIVNATEVLNAFPEEDGLQKFREWIESPDPSILGKASSTKKRGSNSSSQEASTVNPDDDIDRMKQIFMDKHRNVSKNWHIPSTFPSDAVISAYVAPQVDRSTEPFSWGKPDLFVLRKLCWEKFGWGSQKADELLQPVLKEYNKHETQLRLEAFYTFNERFAKIRSKRISKAVKGIAGSKTSELMDDDNPSSRKKRKKVKKEEGEADVAKEQVTTSIENSNLSTQEGKRKNKKERPKRGRGRGQSGGRKNKKNVEVSETSSDDENNSDYVQEIDAERMHQVRKSKRVRKSVIYNEEDEDRRELNVEGFKEEESLVDIGIGVADEEAKKGGTESEEKSLVKICVGNEEGEKESEEYLKMGGGFCLDEEEEGKSREMTETSSVDPQNNQQVEEADVSYLSAMPNLRRRKRNKL